ncbi:hypothetical protein [Cryptosporangium minutisporangium]|uniref:Uncharacterized protein n=1 Tax=Cryptosporangium minutisporangium TaxID=113569 RepID=A0ABP6T1D2_9ACTN
MKAALVVIVSVVVAVGVYGVTGNMAVPSAIVLSGIVAACMAVALGDDQDLATPNASTPDRTAATRTHAAADAWPSASARRPDPDAAAWRAAQGVR